MSLVPAKKEYGGEPGFQKALPFAGERLAMGEVGFQKSLIFATERLTIDGQAGTSRHG